MEGEKNMAEADAGLVERAITALRERVPDHSCPRCMTDDWKASILSIWCSIGPSVGMFSPNLWLQPSAIPALVITCKKCGWTGFHNLKILGVIE